MSATICAISFIVCQRFDDVQFDMIDDVILTREVQIFYGILHHNVGAPLELLETLSLTF